MSKPCLFVAGLGLGALVTPIAQVLAARYAGQHFLAIIEKEFT